MSKAKRNALLLLSVTGILTLVLVMGLSTISLSSGASFSLGEEDVTMPGVAKTIPGDDVLLWMLRGFIVVCIIGLLIYIITSFFSPEGRRRLLANLVVVLFLFWLLDYVEDHPIEEGAIASETETAEELGGRVESVPNEVFSAEEAPPWLATVVILAASLLGAGLIVAGMWYFRQRAVQPVSPLDSLAETAQDTLKTLQSGGDFRTAIIRCYHEMNQVIEQERGISRRRAMTPREFETHLASHGLPQGALETLTRLFEQSRYGNAPPRTEDEVTAVACLTQIVDSCKAPGFSYEQQ